VAPEFRIVAGEMVGRKHRHRAVRGDLLKPHQGIEDVRRGTAIAGLNDGMLASHLLQPGFESAHGWQSGRSTRSHGTGQEQRPDWAATRIEAKKPEIPKAIMAPVGKRQGSGSI
jgi:hypothetical protein